MVKGSIAFVGFCASCSSGRETDAAQSSTSIPLDVPAPDPGGPEVSASASPTDTRAPEAGPRPTEQPPGPDGTTAPTTGDPSQPAPPQTAPPNPNVATGQFGPQLLGSATGSVLVVELMQQAGAGVRGATIEHARQVLADTSGKEIRVPAPVALPGEGRDWTAAEIRNLADDRAQAPQGGGQVVMRLLFLRGTFEGNDGVLGVAVRGDVAAVFTDRVEASGGPLFGFNTATVEDAVTMHEIGHLLGLVDLALATGRQDPEHPGHSRNESSVMFWAVESGLLDGVITGGPPTDFDSQDRADLQAIRSAGS